MAGWAFREHSEGISHKAGKDARRWGVGKTVFLRSSELNTILCLSVRGSDGSRILSRVDRLSDVLMQLDRTYDILVP